MHKQNVSQAERLASIALGSLALARSLSGKRGFVSRVSQGVTGAGLLWRGLSGHCMMYEKMGKDTLHGALPEDYQQSILVNRPLDDVRAILGEGDPVWQNSESTIFPVQAGDQIWDLYLKETHDGRRTSIKASPKRAMKIGKAKAKVLKQALDLELRRVKALIETGEVPTVEGQPHGERSAVGRAVEKVSKKAKAQARKEIPAVASAVAMEAGV